MEKINLQCTCPKTECERYNNCTECEAFHSRKGKLPHCKRKKWRIKPLILNSFVLFVFALLWNAFVHFVILKNQNELLESIHRPDLHDKMWISLIVTLLITILFTISFRHWQKERSLLQAVKHSLFFALLICVVVDLNQYVMYNIPFQLIVLWMLFGTLEFMVYGIISYYLLRKF